MLTQDQANSLRALINAHADARVALSWKGSLEGATDRTSIELEEQACRANLDAYIELLTGGA